MRKKQGCACGGNFQYCSPVCRYCRSNFCDACGRVDAARSGSAAARLVALTCQMANNNKINADDVHQFAADVHAFLQETPRPTLLAEYRASGERSWQRILQAVNHLHQTMGGGRQRLSARLAVARSPATLLLCVPARACVSAMEYVIERIESLFTDLDNFVCSTCHNNSRVDDDNGDDA